MQGEQIVIINRTSKPLEVKQNGATRRLLPGRNHLSADWARFAKLQNPRMGTFDAGGLEGDYLVGVEGIDDCSPIEPGEEHHGVERFNRALMEGEAATAVAINSGVTMPQRRVPQDMSGLPAGSFFAADGKS